VPELTRSPQAGAVGSAAGSAAGSVVGSVVGSGEQSEPDSAPLVPPRRRRSVGVWLGVVAAAGGLACWAWLRDPGPEPPPAVLTASVDRGPIVQTVTATGTAYAVQTVEVGAQVSGRIAELLADDNDEIRAGQVLARIEGAPFAAGVAQARAAVGGAEAAVGRAEAELKRAQRELARRHGLARSGAVGSAQIDEAHSAVEFAQAAHLAAVAERQGAAAALREARLALERTTIASPIDGIVLSRAVEMGQSVAAAFQAPVLFVVARDLRQMELRVAIDEADVGKLRDGQAAQFSVDAYREQTFAGVVEQIRKSPIVTQGVVTYEAVIRFVNPDKRVWPGMTATAHITVAERPAALRVPNAALRFKPPRRDGDRADGWSSGVRSGNAQQGEDAAELAGPGARRVFVVGEGGYPQRVHVRIGIANERYSELVEGALAEGDKVIVDVANRAAARPYKNQRSRPRF
jgi:HlyD family secretion protein